VRFVPKAGSGSSRSKRISCVWLYSRSHSMLRSDQAQMLVHFDRLIGGNALGRPRFFVKPSARLVSRANCNPAAK
jgi:hypothetical protein